MTLKNLSNVKITCSILVVCFLSVTTLFMIQSNQAYGHAFVTSSNPTSSQSLNSSPGRVDIFFSEPVDIKYSKIKILDQSGKQVDNKDSKYLNGDQSSLSVTLPQLKDGVYTVSTTVLSQTDGHVTDNAFVFAVGEGQRISLFNTISKLFQTYPPLSSNGLPFGMAFDNYGNIWVAEHTINKMAVIDPLTGKSKEVKIPNQTPFVQWITSDSDGNLWFAEQRGHALGMVTSKVVSTTVVPSAATEQKSESNQINPMINLIGYDSVVGPAIVGGLVLIAFMYVKAMVDCKIAEKVLMKRGRV